MPTNRVIWRQSAWGWVSVLSLMLAAGPAWAEPAPSPTPSESGAIQASNAPTDADASTYIAVPPPRIFYYYNSNLAGAYRFFTADVSNLAGYKYDNAGTTSAGLGQYVKNNAASIRHYSYSPNGMPVVVFFYSGYGFPADACVPNCAGNLSPGLKNNNASHRWQW